ncbi:MAG: hypothetical protein IT371_03540 [Deltaproteobacteria bacterium]|nr:hypothetical protein [Deltaproteobacteria bacterium]
MRAFCTLGLLAAAMVGCVDSTGGTTPGTKPTLTVKGRVVDFESCLSAAGCKGAPNMKVALFYDTAVASEKTGPDGGFTLKGVPVGGPGYVFISDASGEFKYLSALQAQPVRTDAGDVFGVEAFALSMRGGLYDGVVAEAKARVETHALYLGQVVALKEGTMKALEGASARTNPGSTVRYVRDNPRFNAGQQTLFESARAATGVFGQFIVITKPDLQDYTIAAAAKGLQFPYLVAPLGAGYLTIGLHRPQ